MVIHIGPPKTATTSLQNFFMSCSNERFIYLGINQPRAAKKTSDIFEWVVNGKSSQIRTQLESALSKKKNVVLSEEMLVFHQEHSSITEKLHRLHTLLGDFDPIICFATRDLSTVLFSYYVEVFHLLSRKLQLSFSKFQTSRYCDCYRYQHLVTTMREIGFRRFHSFPFRSLVDGQLMLSDVIGIPLNSSDVEVKLGKANSTSEKNKGCLVYRRGFMEEILSQEHGTLEIFRGNNPIIRLARRCLKSRKLVQLAQTPILKELQLQYEADLRFLESVSTDSR